MADKKVDKNAVLDAPITSKTFFPEERELIKKCLAATASGAYVDANDVEYVTGYDVEVYSRLLVRFDDLPAIRREDLMIAIEAVGVLCNFYTPSSPRLDTVLGVNQLSLKWFWHRLLYIGDHWARFVADGATREDGAKYNKNGEWRF